MTLLKTIVQNKRQQDLIAESAAAGSTSAGSVAGFRGHFFGEPTGKKKKKKKAKLLRRAPIGSIFGFKTEGVEDAKFDPADVISKLKTAEQKAQHEDETTGFALEDEEGRIVKVFVAKDEAKDFEIALGNALAGDESDNDESDYSNESSSLEIAEVLFNLKDRFTIVDVEWPEIKEEEQEEGTNNAQEDLDVDLEGEGEDEGEDEDGMEAALQGEEGGVEGGELGGGEEDARSALDAVIDLLKAQADATKAEAQAREAEANAEEAKYNSHAAESKVKQEEEVLDMEAHYEKQSKIDKEAKQLSKLARWKHETAQNAQNKAKGESAKFKMPAREEDNEETYDFEEPKLDYNDRQNRELQPGEFIKYMFRNVKSG